MRDLVPFAPVGPCDVIGSSVVGAAGCAVADGVGQLGTDAVAAGARSGFETLAFNVGESAAEIFAWLMTFWIRPQADDALLGAAAPAVGGVAITPNSSAVQGMQDYLHPIVVLVLMVSVIAQAARMMVSRKKDPAVDIAVGLVRFVLFSSLGLVVLAGALKAADALAVWIIDASAQKFSERMAGVFEFLLATQPFTLIAIAGLIFFLSVIQVIMLFFRQAGILVLATMIPLAASGSINRSTRPWMSKLTGWLVSLVAYKPMAAIIYAIGFQLMGEAEDLATAVTGVMVLILAVLALPAMLRFFQWSGPGSGGGAGVAGVLAAGATGAIALSQIAGRGSANQQASAINQNGPQTTPTGATQAPSPPAAPTPTGAGPQAGAGATGAAAAGAAAAHPAAAAAVIAAGAVRKAPGAAADKMTGES